MNFTATSPAIATTTPNCDCTPILLDPMLIKYLSLGIRCKVRLVSEELELDDLKLVDNHLTLKLLA